MYWGKIAVERARYPKACGNGVINHLELVSYDAGFDLENLDSLRW